MSDEKLSVKQEKFCLEYAKSGNATEAYKLAGFKVKSDENAASSSARLLRNVKVQKKLRQIQAELKSSKIMEIVEMKERLTAIARREVDEEIVTVRGKKVIAKNSVKDALKAIELIGKTMGAFVTKSEVDINGVVPIVVVDNVRE